MSTATGYGPGARGTPGRRWCCPPGPTPTVRSSSTPLPTSPRSACRAAAPGASPRRREQRSTPSSPRLEEAGLGLATTTAPGDLTIGGVLAIGGHGTGLPTATERPPAGSGFGTLSSLVTSLTAVVWSAAAGRYVLKTFTRSDPDIRAFLVHLGRAFVTEVTMTRGGQHPAALPELVRRERGHRLRSARYGRPHDRLLPGAHRTRRSDLVPVHRCAVAEGVEPGTVQAAARQADRRPVRLHLRQPCHRGDVGAARGDRRGRRRQDARVHQARHVHRRVRADRHRHLGRLGLVEEQPAVRRADDTADRRSGVGGTDVPGECAACGG